MIFTYLKDAVVICAYEYTISAEDISVVLEIPLTKPLMVSYTDKAKDAPGISPAREEPTTERAFMEPTFHL